MKLYELPDKAKLELKFKFQDNEYSMNVILQMKMENLICIQAIKCNGEPLDKVNLSEATLTYKSKDGIYIFSNLTFKLVTYQGIYMYALSSNFEASRLNRRQDYRVFVSEPIVVKLIKENGKSLEVTGLLKDISLSGMGIILTFKTENTIASEIRLNISENKSVKLVGEIINTTELQNGKGFLYGCMFDGKKEILSRYILKQQIKNKESKKLLDLK
ncbi:MAG: PilZ domain [Anaerocolumna sp.]|nr:PilZ domain [Anaerocolumna sp.]